MDSETKRKAIKTQKRTTPLFSHLDGKNSVNKGFFYMTEKINFVLRSWGSISTDQEWSISVRSRSQSKRRIKDIINAFVISVIQTTTFSSPIFIFLIRTSGTKPKKYLSLVDPWSVSRLRSIKSNELQVFQILFHLADASYCLQQISKHSNIYILSL